jgi:phosphoribosylanthranilate isomerase
VIVGALEGGSRVHVKICGVTTPEDAEDCVEAGASAIGVNLVPESPRYVDVDAARRIALAVASRALVVLVVRDLPVAEMLGLRARTGAGCLQLHGDEAPEDLEPLLPHAYKAIGVATREDVARAARYGGDYLLVDARTELGSGGTGRTFDWSLVTELARARKLVLAGGLTPDNVADAVRAVRPHTVDVASGVEQEGRPRKKDLAKVRAFILAAGSPPGGGFTRPSSRGP